MKALNRTLLFGDNLKILREKFPPNDGGYFDLIYLDPPFNSKKDYNILFKEGFQNSPAQVHAFEDSWHWGKEAQTIFEELIGVKDSLSEISIKITDLMLGLEKIIGHNDMMAYLTMMTIRLIELRRVLKDTGSIYLHCDPTASHYLKLVMDVIFGFKNFKREIIWSVETSSGYKSKARNWIRGHDTILFYIKTDDYFFEKQFLPHKEEYIKRFHKTDKKGRRYRDDRRGRVQYLDNTDGIMLGDVWNDIMSFQQASTSKERLGYPTQKPVSLLERIILASSPNGGWILDPFCGCGTTISAAEKHSRNWVGIDITSLAVNLIKHRLEDEYTDKYRTGDLKITVDGLPSDIHGAYALADKDKFEFQYWALDMIGARANQSKKNKKGADSGIDGIYTYSDEGKEGEKASKRLIVSVKGGKNISVKDIRDLKGVIERERVEGGIFVTLYDPTEPMKKEATLAGHFKNRLYNKEYPKLQIITITEIMAGRKPDLPSGVQPINYYKEAPKSVKLDSAKQKKLTTD